MRIEYVAPKTRKWTEIWRLYMRPDESLAVSPHMISRYACMGEFRCSRRAYAFGSWFREMLDYDQRAYPAYSDWERL